MKNRILFLASLVVSIAFVFYWAYFVKVKKVENTNFFTLCRASGSPLSIHIDLLESSKYIDHVDKRKVADTLYIDIYTTTMLNVFASKKKASIDLTDLDGVNQIIIANKQYQIAELKMCR